MRAAVLIEKADDVARLPLDAAARWCSLTVIAIPAWTPITDAFAPLSGWTTAELVRRTALAAAVREARDAASALATLVTTRHVAYAGWRAPEFLATLRRGAFDTALFAASPPWMQRRAVFRAARIGGVGVVRLGGRHPRFTGGAPSGEGGA